MDPETGIAAFRSMPNENSDLTAQRKPSRPRAGSENLRWVSARPVSIRR